MAAVRLPLPTIARPDFFNDAACRGTPVAAFFPDADDYEAVETAKAVCATCSVRDACLEHGIATGEMGIYGGQTEDERRAAASRWRRRRRAGRPGPDASARCGTRSGYNRHRREGTTPCSLCREAERIGTAAYREKRDAS